MTSASASDQIEAIDSACRRHRVAGLHAFGSVVGPDFRPGESDLDLLVEFQPDEPGALYKTYFSLLNELRQTLAAPIDLVVVEAIRNPYAKASIEASKHEIYAT
jgi:predicted nucleotidyltransferase